MLDPGFPDGDGGSGDNPPSGRTSAAIMQNLLASLDAASFALNELDPAVINSLHTDRGYMERLQRLMMPVFAFLGSGAQGQIAAAVTPEAGPVNDDGADPVNLQVEGEFPWLLPTRKLNWSSQGPALAAPPTATSPLGSPLKKSGLFVRPLAPDEPPLEASFSRQLKLVEIFLEQDKHLGSQIREGNYMVSTTWWNIWINTCRDSGNGLYSRYTIEPVDNYDLLDPSTGSLWTGLTPAIDQGIQSVSADADFVYVPRTVWESCFERWCGQRKYTGLIVLTFLYSKVRCRDVHPYRPNDIWGPCRSGYRASL